MLISYKKNNAVVFKSQAFHCLWKNTNLHVNEQQEAEGFILVLFQ